MLIGLPLVMFATLMRHTRRHSRVLSFAALTLAAGMAVASPREPAPSAPAPPGADAPMFRQALATWLNDDEAAALPVLAALAAQGNTAARLLLGLIDKTPALQGPYLHHLDRQHRITLLRAPGGLSGRGWLSEIADLPLATAWLTLWTVEADGSVITAFRTLHEPAAARTALTVLAAREHPSLRALDPAEVDPDLLYLLWTTAGPERRAEIALRVPANHPQRALMGQDLDARDLASWLDMATAAAPVATLCEAVCPEDRGACRIEAYRALNSHNALLTLGTPAEALVPQAEFLASPRGRASVMRRILLSTPMRGRRTMLARLSDRVSCLGSAMTAENERYRPQLPALAPAD